MLKKSLVLALLAALVTVPSFAQARPTMPNALGHLVFTPKSITIATRVGQNGLAQFTVFQFGYLGPFGGVVKCPVQLKPLRLDFDRVGPSKSLVTVYLPPQRLSLNIFCNVFVEGGGEISGVVPLRISVSP